MGALRAALRKALLSRPSALDLDCTGTTLLTAAGIKCLVEAEVAGRGQGRDLRAYGNGATQPPSP